ncbi:MAG: hypothetical protein KKC80_05035 [Candidatus Margulisbacteria bacterium]|nr:hypothetical protein [Candidatus Margulisiibacteriota bacterium]MBU1617287.1 hypothetical protein [Candidatus Margulisiibacteriota bacterium]
MLRNVKPAWLALSLLAVITAGCGFPADVQVSRDQELKETTWSVIDRQNKAISLSISESPLNHGVARFRSNSSLPLDDQIALLSRIIKKLPKDRKIDILFIGRLEKAFGSDKTLSQRLAAAASGAPLWKQRKKYLDDNSCVKAIIEQAELYPELKTIFEEEGYKIKLAAVEKVLINEAGLPFDCLTWFSVKREQ